MMGNKEGKKGTKSERGGMKRVAGKGVKIDMLGFAEDSSFNYDHVTGHGRKKRTTLWKEKNKMKDTTKRGVETCDLGF